MSSCPSSILCYWGTPASSPRHAKPAQRCSPSCWLKTRPLRSPPRSPGGTLDGVFPFCLCFAGFPPHPIFSSTLSFFSFPQKKNTRLRPQDRESRDASGFPPHFPEQLGKPWFMLELSWGLWPEEDPSDQGRTPGWTCLYPSSE